MQIQPKFSPGDLITFFDLIGIVLSVTIRDGEYFYGEHYKDYMYKLIIIDGFCEVGIHYPILERFIKPVDHD